jgi:hypothetical protein
MTRQPHDQLAKDYLEELLKPLGEVQPAYKVQSEVREVDLWFVPQTPNPQYLQQLGLLGQLVQTPCLLEPYRNPPTPEQIRSCLLKLHLIEANRQRQGRRDQQSLPEADLPFLWILTPTCSQRILTGFGATPEDDAGVYTLHEFLRSGIIAINQLDETPETLWLRVLGKGGTQQRAIQELINLPPNHPFRGSLLEILADWHQTLALRDNISTSEQEDIMNLSPAYLKQREELLQEGREEGLEEGEVRGKLKTVPTLQELGLSIERIAEVLELDIEQVRAYLNNQSES